MKQENLETVAFQERLKKRGAGGRIIHGKAERAIQRQVITQRRVFSPYCVQQIDQGEVYTLP